MQKLLFLLNQSSMVWMLYLAVGDAYDAMHVVYLLRKHKQSNINETEDQQSSIDQSIL
jgi:hypothetical protein